MPLYIMATPIGNLEDLSFRALAVLKEADWIACEDTRRTKILMDSFQIQKTLYRYDDHVHGRVYPQLLHWLQRGDKGVILTDSGTPAVSDPGALLVKEAIKKNIPVVPVPGPSAPSIAMSVSGALSSGYRFVGFLPRKEKQQKELIENHDIEKEPMIFFESPLRVIKSLKNMQKVFGETVQVVVCREMTKKFEEFIRGPIEKVIQTIKQKPVFKGEVTVVVFKDKETGREKSQEFQQISRFIMEEKL